MPFGPFASFDDCMSRLAERYPEPETRQRVCGALQSRLGEKSEHGHAVLELPDDARSEWMDAYLESLEKNDESGAAKVAWATVYRRWERGANGAWNPLKTLDDIQFKSLTKQDRIIYGAASVAIVDSENELITESALKSAFNSYVTRGHVLFYHRNIPIGEVLPSYTAADGKIYKSGVSNGKLDIVVRLYKDTQIANDVWDAIEKGELRAFSIGGQVIGDTVKVCQDDSCSMSYERVDHIDLHEISIVPSPANDASYFTIVKGKSHRMTEKQDTKDESTKLVALRKLIMDEKTKAVNCPGFTERAMKILNGEEETVSTPADMKYDTLQKELGETRERLESLIETVSLLVVKTIPIRVTK